MTPFRCDVDCPVEIWSIILDFACNEGSLPAIFLSRVSQRFQRIAQKYLHHVRIGSTPQLLELDGYLRREPDSPGMADAAPRGTRFLSIVLPHSPMQELDLLFPLFNSDDPSYVLPSSESSDIDNEDDRLSTGSSASDDSDLATATYEYAEVTETEIEELQSEVQDLLEDTRLMPSHYPIWPESISTLEEMKFWSNASIHRDCDVLKAIRHLLTVCADTLEVLHVSFKPFNLVTPSLLFPVLPKLQRLTVVWGIETCHIPDAKPRAQCLFPSLQRVRFSCENGRKDKIWHETLLSLAYLTPERNGDFRVESNSLTTSPPENEKVR